MWYSPANVLQIPCGKIRRKPAILKGLTASFGPHPKSVGSCHQLNQRGASKASQHLIVPVTEFGTEETATAEDAVGFYAVFSARSFPTILYSLLGAISLLEYTTLRWWRQGNSRVPSVPCCVGTCLEHNQFAKGSR